MDASTNATPASDPSPLTPIRARSPWLLLLLFGPALLWHCWRAPFFPLDDVSFIVKSSKLADSTPWLEMWHRTPSAFYYYPLTLTSWRLDRVAIAPMLSGLAGNNAWPAAIRLTSLLLHLGAAWMVFGIVRRLGLSRTACAFVLAAFALHPAACESVCWCVERKTVLAGFCGLAAVFTYMSARTKTGFAAAAMLYAAALLSKPSALGLLPVLLAWEALGRPGFDRIPGSRYPPGWWKSAALRVLPWIALAACGTWIGLEQHKLNVLPPPGGSVFTALLTDVDILFRYVMNFLWPAGLSGYYAVAPITSFADGRLWACAAGLAAFVSVTVLLCDVSSRRLACFGWLWFLGALGPNLNLIGINDLMHDRFAYLSASGLWIAVALAMQGAGRRLLEKGFPLNALRKGAEVAVVLLAITWSATSLVRSELYTGLKPYFEDAILKEPRSASARLYLAGYEKALAADLDTGGRGPEAAEARARAIVHYEAGMDAVDYDRYLFQARAHADLGQLYWLEGRVPEAAAQMEAALQVTRGLGHTQEALADAHRVLGQTSLRRGDLSEALRHFDEALKQTPASGFLLVLRARTLLLLHDSFAKAADAEHAGAALAEAVRTLRSVPEGDPSRGEADRLLQALSPSQSVP